MAARDQRVGDCAVLIGTLAGADVQAVLDLYSVHFPTRYARQCAFELMWLIDRIATNVRSKREEAVRKRQMDEAEVKRRRGNR